LATAQLAASASSAQPIAAAPARSSVLAGHTPNGQPIPCVAGPDGVRVCHGDAQRTLTCALRASMAYRSSCTSPYRRRPPPDLTAPTP
jgi:hypothetical protein